MNTVSIDTNSFDDVEFLVDFPNQSYDTFLAQPPLPVFDERVIEFLDALSKQLMGDNRTKQLSDVATFAFFCRRANIRQLKNRYLCSPDVQLGRGLVLHVSPSNVPINFAFSMVAGLLTGNVNAIKLPSRHFEQVQVVVDAILHLRTQDRLQATGNRLAVLKTKHGHPCLSQLSKDCSVRVIWGGDETVAELRQLPLSPRAFDVTFPDRYSLCAINADKLVIDDNVDTLVKSFYNDTLLFDQNACTAPHLVIWLGEDTNVKRAKSRFWEHFYRVVAKQYSVMPSASVDKLNTFCHQAILSEDIHLSRQHDNNLLWRVALDNLEEGVEHFKAHSGYFSEYHAATMSEVLSIANSKYQTLAYYGYSKEDMQKHILESAPKGIDRVVPIGKTMDFSLTWDGYNLVEVLSRSVSN